MPSTQTLLYPDTLFQEVFLRSIQGAHEGIEIATFLFKTNYGAAAPSDAIRDALKAKQQSGVDVFLVLNYSQYEPDVCIENYRTGLDLAAAGCHVRMGPRNTTFHGKLAIIDYSTVFIGSHNLTRGGLSFNRELTVMFRTLTMARRAITYFNTLWLNSTPISLVAPPSGGGGPVQISLAGVATVGNEIRLSFDVNHTEGVEAFAAVADDNPSLEGARMGETVSPSQRAASVLPEVNAGDTVFLAVQAYREGQAIATSRVLEKVYLPEGTPPGGGDPEPPPVEPPPPTPPSAPTLSSVTQATETTVTMAYAFGGTTNFDRFEFQQRDLQGNWHLIGTTMNAATREWTGTPLAMSETLPFRVAVYNTTGQSAESNTMHLQQAPPEPLTAPTLTSVVRATGDDVTATWEFVGHANFLRFEVQRRDIALIWVTLATVMDEATREWTGAAAGTMEEMPFRVVVFNMAEESAASNEVSLPPLPALAAPVLTTLYRVGAMGLHVDWTVTTPGSFDRFELQQRQTDGVTWTAFATITSPTVRTWEVDFVPYRDETHPVRVTVFDTYGQSAASNEVSIGGPNAPNIESVATASGTTVTVQWTWSGLDFQSYIVQQQDAQQTWQDLAQLFAQTPMQWTGAPNAMQAGRPFRVVVNAGAPSPVPVYSNEVSLIAGPPPAPVLGLITPGVLPTVHVPWTWTGALNFASFVIQQRNGAMVWQDLVTITNPATIDWTGQMLMGGQAWPFRLVVHLTTGESATSAEGYVTQG